MRCWKAVALKLDKAPTSLQKEGAADDNVAADTYCNVAVESTGRLLAVRLFNATDDTILKNMLHCTIARGTMHQQQWLAAIDEPGGAAGTLPIPNSLPQEQEDQQNNYNFDATAMDKSVPEGRWTSGPSIDGKGEFTVFRNEPLGDTPVLGGA